MLKDITYGQYYESGSVIHRIDARVKILLLILIIVFIFISSNLFSILFSALGIFTIILVSGVPFSLYAKNLKAILPILLITFVINLFYGEGEALISFWKLSITTGGLYRAFYMSLRIGLLIFISSALTYTTTPNDLTYAIEKLLSPLKYVGLQNAVHTLAMMMTIVLRFIPILVEETQKIMNAQKARGADLENGSLMRRIKALIPILIPLLISSIRHAYELAEAMECRCYTGGEGRTRMKQMRLTKIDFYSSCFAVFGCLIVILLNIIF